MAVTIFINISQYIVLRVLRVGGMVFIIPFTVTHTLLFTPGGRGAMKIVTQRSELSSGHRDKQILPLPYLS